MALTIGASTLVWLVWESGYDWALSPCMWPKAVAVGGLNAWSRRRRRRRGRRWTPQGSQRVVQLFRVSTGYIGIRLMGASPPHHTYRQSAVCMSVCCLYACLLAFLSPNCMIWIFKSFIVYLKTVVCELVNFIWLKTFLLCEVVFSIWLPLWLHNIFLLFSPHSVSSVTFWDFDCFRLQVNKNPAILHV